MFVSLRLDGVICAPITPYRQTSRDVRAMVEAVRQVLLKPEHEAYLC